MRLLNFVDDGKIKLGIEKENKIIDVEKIALKYNAHVPITMEEVLNDSSSIKKIENLCKENEDGLDKNDIVYAPCVMNPEKILCVGLNYLTHREECNLDIPKEPVIFSKFNSSLAAHEEKIELPKDLHEFDYEAELIIVIGKEGKNIKRENADEYIFGYSIGNDLTSRELQFLTSQWTLGKVIDKFTPVGPIIVSKDELNISNLEVKCEVNGEVRQLASTKDMIFDCYSIVSYVSKYITLKPGDIIFTGTPGGVILGDTSPNKQWLKSGDEIKISIENIGTLINVLK